ncbi:hypothetical protein L228DRAFT_268015 [Xylona heveae TC161]|uniref:Uncharacterized protein n=1 Tax=Xylona heveae (strain CBS 132557 / TC161) TaxID=1328760 RepID=A0A165GUX0_XYLHT|nr:hypothetical protein L228DRAFT_268015 [Xylona heveae TC161]KZF22625.1 hypothetical protein L228DRAFT_268015 [Xylona heveae TC161]
MATASDAQSPKEQQYFTQEPWRGQTTYSYSTPPKHAAWPLQSRDFSPPRALSDIPPGGPPPTCPLPSPPTRSNDSPVLEQPARRDAEVPVPGLGHPEDAKAEPRHRATTEAATWEAAQVDPGCSSTPHPPPPLKRDTRPSDEPRIEVETALDKGYLKLSMVEPASNDLQGE